MHVLVAEQRVLPAAEGVERHRYRHRHVDADHADLDPTLELPSGLPAGGEDRGAVTVRVGVDQSDGLLDCARSHHRQHRPEDLFAVDVHLGGHLVDDGRSDEEPALKPWDRQVAAIDRDPGTLVGTGADQRLDALLGGPRVDRSHLTGRVAARAHLQRAGAFGHRLDDVCAVADDDRGRDGHAAFARGPEGRRGQVVGREVDVGVRQDDGMVLGPAQCLHALAVRRAALVDVARDGGRTDERHCRDPRVVQQRVDRLLVTVDDVEHPVG